MGTKKPARKAATDDKALRKLAERNLRAMGWTANRSARDHELDVQDTMARLRAMRRGSSPVSIVGQRSRSKRKKPKRRPSAMKRVLSLFGLK